MNTTQLKNIYDNTMTLELPGIGEKVTALRLAGFYGYKYIKISNWNGIRYHVNMYYDRRTIKVGWINIDGSDFSTKNYDWQLHGQEAVEIVKAIADRVGFYSKQE